MTQLYRDLTQEEVEGKPTQAGDRLVKAGDNYIWQRPIPTHSCDRMREALEKIQQEAIDCCTKASSKFNTCNCGCSFIAVTATKALSHDCGGAEEPEVMRSRDAWHNIAAEF